MSKRSRYAVMIHRLFLFAFLLSTCHSLLAQDKVTKSIRMENPPVINADLQEWGDSLLYNFEGQGMRYSLANDDEYLYVSIQVKDQASQLKAIYSGFSISVNKEGKQKQGPTVIFPIPDLAARRSMDAKEEIRQTKDMRQAGLNMVRAIYVAGFDKIVDGPISMENLYGIRTAVKLDSAGNLNYEAAISLKQLDVDRNKAFALNIRINETTSHRVTEPAYNRGYGSPYGRNRYGYGNYGTRSRVVSKEAEGIWHYVELAAKN